MYRVCWSCALFLSFVFVPSVFAAEVDTSSKTEEKTTEAVKAIIVKQDESLTEEEVKAFCKEELTNYKRPKYVEFRDELPKTNVGKPDKKELRIIAQA